MITAVDTNILIDVLNKDKRYFESSRRLLGTALKKGSLIINEVVYAELVSQFKRREKLDEFLNDTGITLCSSSKEALQEGSRAWKEYITRQGKELQCPHCGAKMLVKCKNCSNIISIRQHIISDFLIGGYAKAMADSLLTRDRGYYKTYFKELALFG